MPLWTGRAAGNVVSLPGRRPEETSPSPRTRSGGGLRLRAPPLREARRKFYDAMTEFSPRGRHGLREKPPPDTKAGGEAVGRRRAGSFCPHEKGCSPGRGEASNRGSARIIMVAWCSPGRGEASDERAGKRAGARRCSPGSGEASRPAISSTHWGRVLTPVGSPPGAGKPRPSRPGR